MIKTGPYTSRDKIDKSPPNRHGQFLDIGIFQMFLFYTRSFTERQCNVFKPVVISIYQLRWISILFVRRERLICVERKRMTDWISNGHVRKAAKHERECKSGEETAGSARRTHGRRHTRQPSLTLNKRMTRLRRQPRWLMRWTSTRDISIFVVCRWIFDGIHRPREKFDDRKACLSHIAMRPFIVE